MSCESVTSVEDLAQNEANVRKRVGKACDRCRLKKSKCDGSKPCSRCKADNQLCLFGERKKSQDKIYPKGYVELLEHQQSLLVSALQLVYRQYWTGPSLPEVEGYPLVHDLLESLGLLQDDGSSSPAPFEGFHFEEDPVKMQARLSTSEGGGKRSSRSTASPPSHSPVSTQPSLFSDAFSSVGPSTPVDQFPNLAISSNPSSFFPFTHSPTSISTHAQLYQLNQNLEQMKQSGIFPTTFSNGPHLPTDMDFETFTNSFPLISSFNEMSDINDDDPFGNFVDLGTA